ncbi:MAG: calcium-binding protein [Pseudomonadota bacterium]
MKVEYSEGFSILRGAAGNGDGNAVFGDEKNNDNGSDSFAAAFLRGNDYIAGYEGDDKLFGREGDDKIFGGVGIDTLYGGAGNDSLNAGGYAYGRDVSGEIVDVAYGGTGDDEIWVGDGSKLKAYGGDGFDTLNASYLDFTPESFYEFFDIKPYNVVRIDVETGLVHLKDSTKSQSTDKDNVSIDGIEVIQVSESVAKALKGWAPDPYIATPGEAGTVDLADYNGTVDLTGLVSPDEINSMIDRFVDEKDYGFIDGAVISNGDGTYTVTFPAEGSVFGFGDWEFKNIHQAIISREVIDNLENNGFTVTPYVVQPGETGTIDAPIVDISLLEDQTASISSSFIRYLGNEMVEDPLTYNADGTYTVTVKPNFVNILLVEIDELDIKNAEKFIISSEVADELLKNSFTPAAYVVQPGETGTIDAPVVDVSLLEDEEPHLIDILAIALQKEQIEDDAIVDNGDGKYSVTFIVDVSIFLQEYKPLVLYNPEKLIISSEVAEDLLAKGFTLAQSAYVAQDGEADIDASQNGGVVDLSGLADINNIIELLSRNTGWIESIAEDGTIVLSKGGIEAIAAGELTIYSEAADDFVTITITNADTLIVGVEKAQDLSNNTGIELTPVG